MPKAPPKPTINSKPTVVKQSPKPQKKTGGSILDRIQEIDTEGPDKVALYGESGTGKTTFWATFPGPILCVTCSGGVRSGELKSLATPEYKQKIRQAPVEKSTDVFDIAAHYRERTDFATIVLDHASGLQHLCLAEVLGVSELDLAVQKSWGLATQQQWGQVATQVKELLRALLNMPQHTVIVAQQRSFDPTEDGESIVMPYVGAALTPSIVGWLNPAVDFICQTFKRGRFVETVTEVAGQKVTTRAPTKGVDYFLRTGPHGVYTTKFRVPKGQALTTLPDDIINPTYEKFKAVADGKKLPTK